MQFRTWAVVSFALGLSVICTRAQQTIPKSQGTTLAGTTVGLPDVIKGKAGVLVIGFSKSSRGQVAGWGRRLAADLDQPSNVVYFEVAMLGGAPRILRGMIVKSIASSVPEGQWSHFLPLAENEAEWRAVAHYNRPDDAYVLLIDDTGAIRWHTEGDVTDAAYTSLKKNLDALTAQDGATRLIR